MSRAVLAWCNLYTAVAPPPARQRRREELASHLWEATEAGFTRLQLLRGAARGVIDDVRWCALERRLAGLPPVIFGPNGSTALAGLLMALTYALALANVNDAIYESVAVVAAAVLAVSFTDRVVRRRRRRSRSA